VVIGFAMNLVSCQANYHVTKKKLALYWPKQDSFTISKIEVDSFTTRKMLPFKQVVVPSNYKRTSTIECIPYEVNGKHKPDDDIYFWKTNKYYRWRTTGKLDTTLYELYPDTFERSTWYEFSGFPENLVFGEDYTIYLFIDAEGKFNDYHVYLNPHVPEGN